VPVKSGDEVVDVTVVVFSGETVVHEASFVDHR
jgi:hypothetical protein